jgi:hypothetical protein
MAAEEHGYTHVFFSVRGGAVVTLCNTRDVMQGRKKQKKKKSINFGPTTKLAAARKLTHSAEETEAIEAPFKPQECSYAFCAFDKEQNLQQCKKRGFRV